MKKNTIPLVLIFSTHYLRVHCGQFYKQYKQILPFLGLKCVFERVQNQEHIWHDYGISYLSYFHKQLSRQLFFYEGETCGNFNIVCHSNFTFMQETLPQLLIVENYSRQEIIRNNTVLSLRNENYEIDFYFMAHCVQVKDESQGSIAPLTQQLLSKNPISDAADNTTQ